VLERFFSLVRLARVWETRPLMRRLGWILVGIALLGSGRSSTAGAQEEQERLSAGEREVLAADLRRGRAKEVLGDLDEIVAELPDDFGARSLRAIARYEIGDLAGALEDAEAAGAASVASAAAPPEDAAFTARVQAEMLVELGRAREALLALRSLDEIDGAALDPRNAWILGRASLEAGEREPAKAAFLRGAEVRSQRQWESLLAQARCQRALGRLEQAAGTLAAADLVARRTGGVEPDVLVEWGSVKFEGFGEIEGATSDRESSGSLYREALRIHGRHEGALLGLLELGRANWNRGREAPGDLLETMLEARPDSIRAHLARVSLAIDDGDLRTARASLAKLEELAPGRRDVRAQRAAYLWIDHRREEARELLADLAREDPLDSGPEREVARHLLELYRFEEGRPFAAEAVERDSADARAWKELGRAQANTGDETAARVSLQRSRQVAEGRQDAWRANTLLVLERMDEELVMHDAGSLRFLWKPEGAEVLATYYLPFYLEVREDVARRYGFTPDEVQIEVFHRWEDFSVRSTGFEGFPALGVCFGPVVTAVSPLSELRGQFSWARTAWHEFTHVVHLGLSHNRCPRWVTEGLATWEEVARRSSWTRNSRRELFDARANGEILRIRDLNGAFRGPRILFAYYQSGLLCEMLVGRYGLGPMVRLLLAFDRGADLDRAFSEVFARTPEELDRDFLAFVDEKLAGLAIEPRWSANLCQVLALRLGRNPPTGDAPAARSWAEDWCRVAWGRYWAWQRAGKGDSVPVDVEEALRLAGTAGELPPRGLFLRGELALARGDRAGARADLRAGFAAGGEDYRARMAFGALLAGEERERSTVPGRTGGAGAGEVSAAIEEFRAAERAFPGYDDPHFSAELRLAALLDGQGLDDEANEARLRWLGFNADNFEIRVEVAEWLDGKGRSSDSAQLWEEANEIDPFRRHVHVAWGRALARLARHAEAAREFGVARRVSAELDGDAFAAGQLARAAGFPSLEALLALSEEDLKKKGEAGEALLGVRAAAQRFRGEESIAWGEEALVLIALGRREEARAAVENALALDPACASALRARERLSSGGPDGSAE